MNTLVDVRFIRSWQNYAVGRVIRPNGVLRDWLVRAGFVEIVGARDSAKPIRADATPAAPAIATKAKGRK